MGYIGIFDNENNIEYDNTIYIINSKKYYVYALFNNIELINRHWKYLVYVHYNYCYNKHYHNKKYFCKSSIIKKLYYICG